MNTHYGVVVYRRRARDIWAKTFWLECLKCDALEGPYPTLDLAQRTLKGFNASPCPTAQIIPPDFGSSD